MKLSTRARYGSRAMVELALKDQTYLRLGARAQSGLDELQNTIHETVFFGLMHPWQALIMATSESRNPMKISSLPGSTIPLLAGALGKLFLSEKDDGEVEEIIKAQGLPAYTPASISNEQDYLKEVARVREIGYAVDKGEYMSGVNALAVGVGDHYHQPLALWVVGFAESLDTKKIGRIKDSVLATADRLSEDLDTGG
jgi:IclR family KDG regulon transcriptional repressor